MLSIIRDIILRKQKNELLRIISGKNLSVKNASLQFLWIKKKKKIIKACKMLKVSDKICINFLEVSTWQLFINFLTVDKKIK